MHWRVFIPDSNLIIGVTGDSQKNTEFTMFLGTVIIKMAQISNYF